MADFAEIRDQLRLARDARDGAAADVARTVQALKRLATERTALDRRADANGDEATGRRKAFEAREKELRATLDSARERQRALDSAALDLSGQFAAFTDPRKGINRLDDDTPLLLMPLRLETRFKRSAPPGAAPRDELWVRVFPDDCWIDSFDPILTEGEVASAAAYWRALWASGGDPALDRAAWTTLATGHGANRAAWIVRSYQPTNLADRPVRLDASDVFLPITLDSALAPGEATALAAFWRAVWVAAGDATAVGVATTTLELAVGAARAAELIAAHVPANLDAAPPDGVSREDVTVSVPFLLLPSVETKRETWSQAPRARILPDRFVFVGYERENDPTPVTVVGGAVASPLQVGPDPTAPDATRPHRAAAHGGHPASPRARRHARGSGSRRRWCAGSDRRHATTRASGRVRPPAPAGRSTDAARTTASARMPSWARCRTAAPRCAPPGPLRLGSHAA